MVDTFSTHVRYLEDSNGVPGAVLSVGPDLPRVIPLTDTPRRGRSPVVAGDVRVFVQARMASARFPGKALAPLAGRPVIERVLERVELAMGYGKTLLLTTDEPSDDPLALFVEERGQSVYRGSSDVVERFQEALGEYPCERFFRVCGDSPLLNPGLFKWFLAMGGEPDLVTNVFPRTFPKGQSLELIRSDMFAALDSASLTPEQREHPTKFFYDHAGEYNIVNIEVVTRPERIASSWAVDTIEDLRRIEAML